MIIVLIVTIKTCFFNIDEIIFKIFIDNVAKTTRRFFRYVYYKKKNQINHYIQIFI